MPKWKTISLPEEMLTEIRQFIEQKPELGYSSISEFVTSAIRAYVDYRSALSNKEQVQQPS